MVYGAIDLHMRYSQIRIVDADGAVLRDQRVLTTRERLTQAFAGSGAMRILVETGTESEWVAQALEAAGHDVVVADPNYAPMYGELTRKRQDGSPRRGGVGRGQSPRVVSRRASASAAQRETQTAPAEPRLLVQQRAGAVSLLRSLLRQSGYRLGTRQLRDGARAAGAPGRAAGAGRDARAAVPADRGADDGDSRGGRAAADARRRADAIVHAPAQCAGGRARSSATTFRAFVDHVERFRARRPGECGDRPGAARRQFGRAPASRATSRRRARASCAAC